MSNGRDNLKMFCLRGWTKALLVPHSQCSLKENPKFLQNFRSKNNTLKENFWQIFLFYICHCNSGLAFKSKNYFIVAQNCMYFIGENSPKLHQKCKWALWMRHQLRCWSNFSASFLCKKSWASKTENMFNFLS